MKREWVVAFLLAAVAMLNYLDRQVIFSLLPVIRQELHCTDTQLGLLATAFLWVYGTVSPFAGFIAVRVGLRRIIVLSLVIWSSITLLTAFARNPAELITARAVMGLSEAFYLPAGLALIAAIHDKTRSRATALHQSGIYCGMIGGGILGGWAGSHFGWRPLFLALGAVGVLYGAVVHLVLRTLPAEQVPTDRGEPTRKMAAELFGLRAYRMMLGLFCIFSASGWIVMGWMALYLYERFHLSLTEAAFTATFYLNAGSFAGIYLGGWASDRWRARFPSIRPAIAGAGFVLSGFSLLIAATAGEVPIVAACLALYGFGRGLFDCNTMPLLCEIARTPLRAAGYGIFNMIGCLTGGVMTLLAGALKQKIGLNGSMVFAALLTFFAVALLIPIARITAVPRAAEPQI